MNISIKYPQLNLDYFHTLVNSQTHTDYVFVSDQSNAANVSTLLLIEVYA